MASGFSWLLEQQVTAAALVNDPARRKPSESRDAGELTGKNFGSQVKGFAPAPGKPVRLKYSLSTKHLAYYVDKVEYPVFSFW